MPIKTILVHDTPDAGGSYLRLSDGSLQRMTAVPDMAPPPLLAPGAPVIAPQADITPKED